MRRGLLELLVLARVGGLGMEDSSKIDTILEWKVCAILSLRRSCLGCARSRGSEKMDGYEHNNKSGFSSGCVAR